jgi:DHA1 family inner membrane transport protein
MAARFAAGLPHGAFFGAAALVAAHLMGPQNRAKAVAHVMCGLTVATVIGVPMASWLGQALGWRSAFALVVAVGLVTLAALWFWLPARLRAMQSTSPLTELGALRRVQVWLALLVGMIGFGGMFAVYTYISTTMTDVAGLPRDLVPLALMVFGIGMVIGNLVGGRLADRSVVRALYLSMGALGAVLAVFVFASHNPYTAMVVLFGIGATGSAVAPALQTRLMDVAHDAQTLAAALNHSALNIGNATGAWVGGLVIAAGYGYTAPAAAGGVLAAAGILVLTVSLLLQRRTGP